MAIKKQRNEIQEILHQGELGDITDILNNGDVDDAFLIYTDKKGFIKVSGTVNVVTALGMIALASDTLRDIAWEEGKD